MYRSAVLVVLLCGGYACLPISSLAQEDDRANYRANYREYVPDLSGQGCEKPRLDASGFGSTLNMCLDHYKSNDFSELPSVCEQEALLKQKTAPHLLRDYDLKYLANVENRKKACMDLLARKGKLGMLNRISRWLNSR